MSFTRTAAAALTALGVSGLALAPLLLADAAPAGAPSDHASTCENVPEPRTAPSCKPQAPIEIVLDGTSAAQGGALRVDFRVVPGIDVEELWTEVRLPHGGQVLELAGGADGARRAGESVQGSTRVLLPVGYAQLELEAVFLMQSSEGELVRQSATRVLEWGQAIEQSVLSELGSEVTAVAPAVHRGGSPR